MSENFKTWWQHISEREQQLTLLSVVFLLLAIIYWGAWQPLSNQLAQGQEELQHAQQTLDWVQEKASVLVQAGAGKTKNAQPKLNLTQIVNTSAKRHGVAFSRIVNNKDKIAVVISEVDFDRFINWLTSLENQYGVMVSATSVTKTYKEGQIKVNSLVLGY